MKRRRITRKRIKRVRITRVRITRGRVKRKGHRSPGGCPEKACRRENHGSSNLSLLVSTRVRGGCDWVRDVIGLG